MFGVVLGSLGIPRRGIYSIADCIRVGVCLLLAIGAKFATKRVEVVKVGNRRLASLGHLSK